MEVVELLKLLTDNQAAQQTLVAVAAAVLPDKLDLLVLLV
jgi:hypothetical protein